MFRAPPWLFRTIRAARISADSSWTRRAVSSTIGDVVQVPQEAIRLRQYQEECIQSVLSYLEKGHKRLGISLATGSGKTVRQSNTRSAIPQTERMD
jgi:superfamily II DNA or RNA helicase